LIGGIDMTTFRLLLLLILLPAPLYGQNMTNSIGVVTISDDFDNSDHILEFLNDDGSVWNAINLFDEWKPIEGFIIMAFHPDYFLYKIKCKEKTSEYYRVVVNEETGLTKRILISSKLKLQTWEEYVLDVFTVSFNISETSILDKINGSPVTKLPVKNQFLFPKEVKGEWMRIIWTDSNYPTDDSINYSGWIKWKKGNEIIVRLHHLS